jgi:hypothetical protein
MFLKILNFRSVSRLSLYSSDVLTLLLFLPKIAESSCSVFTIFLTMVRPSTYHENPCRPSRIPAPQKRNSSSCLPYEGSPYTTYGISWVLPHFVPFSHTARSVCFSSYITAQQNNSREGFKSSWAFDFAAGYACQSLIP